MSLWNTQRPRRTGHTLIETVLAVTIGAAVLALVFEALRFFSTRSATTTQRAERAREAGLFMQRLRRTLRLAVRVIPHENGFRVLHQDRVDGRLRLVATRVEVSGKGRVTIYREDGTQKRSYDVGGLEDAQGRSLADSVTLEVDLEGGGLESELLRVLLEGSGGDLVLIARVRSLLIERGLFVSEEERSLADLEEELFGRDQAGPRPDLSGLGEGRSESTGFERPGNGEASVVPPGARPLEGGLPEEADLLAAETRPVGVALLPAPSGLPTDLPPLPEPTALRTALEDAGLRPPVAARVATHLEAWDAALRAGERREAGEAVATLDALLRQEGLSGEDVIEVIAGAAEPVLILVSATGSEVGGAGRVPPPGGGHEAGASPGAGAAASGGGAAQPLGPGGAAGAAARGQGDELEYPPTLVDPAQAKPPTPVGGGGPVATDGADDPEAAEAAEERTGEALMSLVRALELAHQMAKDVGGSGTGIQGRRDGLAFMEGFTGDPASELARSRKREREIQAILGVLEREARAAQGRVRDQGDRIAQGGEIGRLDGWRSDMAAASNTGPRELKRERMDMRIRVRVLQGMVAGEADALARVRAETEEWLAERDRKKDALQEHYDQFMPLVDEAAEAASDWAKAEPERGGTALAEVDLLRGKLQGSHRRGEKNVHNIYQQLQAARTLAGAIGN